MPIWGPGLRRTSLNLALEICDPAMGSGAFLVETCRFLADQVVAAWSREGKLEALRGKTDDVVLHARRLVAQRCLYGVDLNPFAVTLARLSMWLVTLAKDAPFTFVDHALRHGDSLVGLTLEQLRDFHWAPPKQRELTSIANEVDAALEEARGYRERILALAEAGAEATEEKERLLRDAELALERARIVGDLVIGAFFAHPKDKGRERARVERLEKMRAWLDSDGELPEELRALREEARRHVVPFHWSIEFPEIFYAARPDPLQERQVTGAAFMDSFLGNTPFAGKNTVADQHGDRYIPWLQVVHAGAHGNADYCAHFFRRAYDLLGDNGTLGFITTNTISQGDTRATSLHHLITRPENGVEIYDAVRSMLWPGLANVAVSVVHLAKGAGQVRKAGAPRRRKRSDDQLSPSAPPIARSRPQWTSSRCCPGAGARRPCLGACTAARASSPIAPCLVVTVFNLYRSRDRSHYERFAAYHQCFYRFVEATSVTPFSAPALDRGLAGVLVTLTRLGEPALTLPEAIRRIDEIRPRALSAIASIARKAADEEEGRSPADAARIAEEMERIGQNLLEAWAQVAGDGPEGGVSCYSTLDKGKGMPLLFTALDADAPNPMSQRAKFAAGTSMRDVEPSVHLWKSKQRLIAMEEDDGT